MSRRFAQYRGMQLLGTRTGIPGRTGGRISLEAELDLACRAALDAGALLREESRRPGGPLGVDGHARADGWVERLIRLMIRKQFPADGLVGRELGCSMPDEDGTRRIWLITPNDGASAVLDATRGSAVSIGLLVDGVPSLGVVHAFDVPDERGDLICWAEGCTLLRNGLPVARDWPDRAQASHRVLVSPRACRHRLMHRLVEPMQFDGLPSIAYRLALVAAGKADLAVSLKLVAGWDVAAGHALMRGAGASLYTEKARPLGYRDDGRPANGTALFGGARCLAERVIAKLRAIPESDRAALRA